MSSAGGAGDGIQQNGNNPASPSDSGSSSSSTETDKEVLEHRPMTKKGKPRKVLTPGDKIIHFRKVRALIPKKIARNDASKEIWEKAERDMKEKIDGLMPAGHSNWDVKYKPSGCLNRIPRDKLGVLNNDEETALDDLLSLGRGGLFDEPGAVEETGAEVETTDMMHAVEARKDLNERMSRSPATDFVIEAACRESSDDSPDSDDQGQ